MGLDHRLEQTAICEPRNGIELASATLVPESLGTAVMVLGHEIQDPFDVPGLREQVLAQAKMSLVAVKRRVPITAESIGVVLGRIKDLNLDNPYLVITHSAGSFPVLEWLRGSGNLESVYSLIVNPPLRGSTLTKVLVSPIPRSVYPRLRWLIGKITQHWDRNYYNPHVHTKTLETIERAQSLEIDPTFAVRGVNRLRFLINRKDAFHNPREVLRIVPRTLVRSWRDYGINNSFDSTRHNPLPALESIISKFKQDVGLFSQ